jgi:hypothetical protein
MSLEPFYTDIIQNTLVLVFYAFFRIPSNILTLKPLFEVFNSCATEEDQGGPKFKI